MAGPQRTHGAWQTAALAGIALLACAGRVWAAGGPRLCIEYLPSLVYEDQPLAVCARVESARAEGLRLSVAARDAGGKVLASAGASGTPRPGAPWRCECSLRLAGGSPAALDVVLTKASGAVALGKASVRVLNPGQALPPLRVEGMRLVDEAGRRAIVRLEHRVYEPEESWPLVRWVAHKLYGERVAFERVVVLGEDLGAREGGYLARLGARKAPFAIVTLAVPSRAEPPSPPILRAVAALSQAPAGKEPPDLAVLSLGHRDPDLGTDVLQFERGLELLVQELERRGCRHVVLVAPLGPSHLAKRLAPYTQAASRVARTYRARLLNLGPRLRDEHFAGGPGGAGVLLRFPNPQGHQALADALARHVARLRR